MIRTDLVSEQREMHTRNISGAISSRETIGDVTLEKVQITNISASKELSKPILLVNEYIILIKIYVGLVLYSFTNKILFI